MIKDNTNVTILFIGFLPICKSNVLTENEAPRDARYSRQERIEVRTFVPKGSLRGLNTTHFVCSFTEEAMAYTSTATVNDPTMNQSQPVKKTHSIAMKKNNAAIKANAIPD